MDRTCNECGSSEWKEWESARTTYPEHRERDRDKTERRVFECRNCGAEGRRFEDGREGAVQFTAAMR